MKERPPSRLYLWATQKATSSRASFWIFLLFFLELFLFIPLDAVLMFFCLQNRKKIFVYVFIAVIASATSGMMGYLLGHFLWDIIGPYVIPNLISAASFDHISSQLQTYENWSVFLGALFPFPLKALSLGSGVFHLQIFSFALCLFSARMIRFLLIGGAMALWGERVKQLVERHFHRILLVMGAKIGVAFLLFWTIAK